ncbi:MAG: bifunctional diaminohydroxyphosphoribosylaminopyrimidine deaminase/5-amino-6-(5-phosphoribosylamino)uracil reductase RibD [Microthrixaceae bacterium]
MSGPGDPTTPRDRELMQRAIAAGADARWVASPNPWVGAILVTDDGELISGATRAPGQAHAEVVAIERAGARAAGSTMYVTLEPCAHHGRTGPCTEAIIEAGLARVVVGVIDPDPRTNGAGIEALRAAGIEVEVGVVADKVEAQLAPYLHQRRTGRPFVVLKLACSLDGYTSAPDGSSKWITGPASRSDGHRLRAESDAIIVGAGTVRADNPNLTVRDWQPPTGSHPEDHNPTRVVLGKAPEGALVHPCLELTGAPDEILADLAERGIIQVLIEGGAAVAGDFHRAGLVDRYMLYLAPALFGGDDARSLFAGPGAWSIDELWRGELISVDRLGGDVRIELAPNPAAADPGDATPSMQEA